MLIIFMQFKQEKLQQTYILFKLSTVLLTLCKHVTNAHKKIKRL